MGEIRLRVSFCMFSLYLKLNTNRGCRERKIVLKGKDKNELQGMYEQAQNLKLVCHVVTDAGRTEVGGFVASKSFFK